MSHNVEPLPVRNNMYDIEGYYWESPEPDVDNEQNEEIVASSVTSAIVISGMRRTIKKGNSIKIPSLNIELPNRVTRKRDVQTFEESDTIPFDLQQWNERKSSAAQARKHADSKFRPKPKKSE